MQCLLLRLQTSKDPYLDFQSDWCRALMMVATVAMPHEFRIPIHLSSHFSFFCSP